MELVHLEGKEVFDVAMINNAWVRIQCCLQYMQWDIFFQLVQSTYSISYYFVGQIVLRCETGTLMTFSKLN
jgi:hypothetical protein